MSQLLLMSVKPEKNSATCSNCFASLKKKINGRFGELLAVFTASILIR